MCSRPNSSFISANPKTNAFNKQPNSICLFGFRNIPAPLLPCLAFMYSKTAGERAKKIDELDNEIDKKGQKATGCTSRCCYHPFNRDIDRAIMES